MISYKARKQSNLKSINVSISVSKVHYINIVFTDLYQNFLL